MKKKMLLMGILLLALFGVSQQVNAQSLGIRAEVYIQVINYDSQVHDFTLIDYNNPNNRVLHSGVLLAPDPSFGAMVFAPPLTYFGNFFNAIQFQSTTTQNGCYTYFETGKYRITFIIQPGGTVTDYIEKL